MEYIKETYDLPFLRKGIQVELGNGRKGVIIGVHNAYLKIKFDDNTNGCVHPTYDIAYFNVNGDVMLKDFRVN